VASTVRIALAQMNPLIGDIDDNVGALLAAYREADAGGCDVVVFGELAVTGYPPEDLVLKDGFVEANRRALDRFVEATGDCAAVVGFVDREGDDLYNAAAVISNGRLHGVYRKQLLPNYRVFDEERYFTPGTSFSLFRIAGVPCGVTICEDIWVASGPVREQARAGAALMLNINGSPYHRGRLGEREEMVSERARDNRCAIVYVNQVCGQDELVFDGGSMVVDAAGHVVARSPQFSEDLLVVDIDVESPVDRHDSKIVDVSRVSRSTGPRIAGRVAPRLDDLDETHAALVLGTRDYVRKNGFTDVVIGLSGGIDSALVAAIAVDALGAEHVHGVSMPSRYSSEGSRDDAAALASNLGIDLRTIAIEPAFSALLDMTAPSFAGRDHDLTEENLQSRVRGTTLMALSNKFGWMVLTTGNKSELAVGYFTLYGDSVGAYAPIRDVFKTTVYALCDRVNDRAGREIIPLSTITKPPSAELRPDQRDDQSLPPYDVLDPILELYVERDLTAGEIVAMGHDEAMVRRIARLVDSNEYKRRQGPPGVRVSTKAFGKDRRMPMTNGYRG
jgi:NAD+ synthase (glutamine-hydrolysing)